MIKGVTIRLIPINTFVSKTVPVPSRDGGNPRYHPCWLQMQSTRPNDCMEQRLAAHDNAALSVPNYWLYNRAFPRAARKGTSTGFPRAEVSVLASASLSASASLLSSVIAF